jgi:glycosidase
MNDWNDSKTRMTDDNGDGIYEVTLLLPIGRYQYKFVVDGQWFTDETAADFAPDGFGGQNSIISVDDSFKEVRFELGDGEMMTSDISSALDYSMVNPMSRDRIEFTARAHRDDVEDVRLIYSVAGAQRKSVGMTPAEADAVFQYYVAAIEEPATAEIRFTFRYGDGEASFYATPKGIVDEMPGDGDMYVYSDDILPPFFTPEWAKDGVFYQIFPERFRNGDPGNDPDFSEPYYEGVTKLPSSGRTNGEYFHFVRNWGDVSGLSRSPYRTDGRPDYYSFYGGDIAGVMEKLPYLKDLGVTIIYFNPLNQARSNHKYDPLDYMTIDPHFADEATFKEFVKAAHGLGIRIIVDKAFNHTGNWHFAFIDSRDKGRESVYWDWYEWKRWPLPEGDITNPLDYYDCWWGFGIHPNLNFDLSRPNNQENGITDAGSAQPNTDLVEYILDVARYWLGELGIDGFRLDVPNEVPFWFWKEFRRVVDEVNPDAFLIGEIWGNAMQWLGPYGFHSTMNYKFFREPVLKFFALGQGSAAQFDRELAPGRSLYPKQATQVMMNLVGSHDTERFLTIASNKEDRLMLAALFQMTYLGIPQIYYGDEVGMTGGKDPDNRRPFTWGWKDNPRQERIHDFYRKIIGIRHAYPALRTGAFRTVLAEGKVYSYLRENDDDRVAVVLNNEPVSKRIELPLGGFGFSDGTRFVDELEGGEYTVDGGTVALEMQPMTGLILVQQ